MVKIEGRLLSCTPAKAARSLINKTDGTISGCGLARKHLSYGLYYPAK
jgi:hypothetical protein